MRSCLTTRATMAWQLTTVGTSVVDGVQGTTWGATWAVRSWLTTRATMAWQYLVLEVCRRSKQLSRRSGAEYLRAGTHKHAYARTRARGHTRTCHAFAHVCPHTTVSVVPSRDGSAVHASRCGPRAKNLTHLDDRVVVARADDALRARRAREPLADVGELLGRGPRREEGARVPSALNPNHRPPHGPSGWWTKTDCNQRSANESMISSGVVVSGRPLTSVTL